jgi:hypothetical protein
MNPTRTDIKKNKKEQQGCTWSSTGHIFPAQPLFVVQFIDFLFQFSLKVFNPIQSEVQVSYNNAT